MAMSARGPGTPGALGRRAASWLYVVSSATSYGTVRTRKGKYPAYSWPQPPASPLGTPACAAPPRRAQRGHRVGARRAPGAMRAGERDGRPCTGAGDLPWGARHMRVWRVRLGQRLARSGARRALGGRACRMTRRPGGRTGPTAMPH